MQRFFFCQAEDGIRDLVRSRGLGDVYKRQPLESLDTSSSSAVPWLQGRRWLTYRHHRISRSKHCLLYTSDAADERSSVDLGGRRIIKKKKNVKITTGRHISRPKHSPQRDTEQMSR